MTKLDRDFPHGCYCLNTQNKLLNISSNAVFKGHYLNIDILSSGILRGLPKAVDGKDTYEIKQS